MKHEIKIIEGLADSRKTTGDIYPHDGSSLIASAMIAGVAATVYIVFALLLWNNGAFGQYNIVFSTDASVKLSELAHGWGAPNLIHPNMKNLVSVPIRAIGYVVAAVGHHDPVTVREIIGLLVSPLAVGFAVFLFGATLALIGIPLMLLAASTVGFAFSLTGLVFGSTPESYGLSLVAITASFYLLARIVHAGNVDGKRSLIGFTALTFLSGSITITNMAIVGIIGFLAEAWRTKSIGYALGRQVLATTIGAACIAIVAVSFVFLRGYAMFDVNDATTSYSRYMVPDRVTTALVRVPSAFANSVTPLDVARRPNTRKGQFDFQYTLEAPAQPNYVGLGVLILVLWGCVGSIRENPAWLPVLLGAAGVFCFNWILHTFWGTEIFLYSAHWLTSLMLFVVIAASAPSRRRWTVPALAVATLAISANNLLLVSRIIAAVDAAAPG